MENKYLFAQKIIRQAGQLIKSEMAKHLEIEEKTRFDDLVTNLDKSTQDFLIAQIQATCPDDKVMAEENGVRHPIDQGKVWVLDPIDGTVNFIVQGDNFAVMIAYFEDGIGQFGLIYDVMNDVLYHGGGQFDVYANDKRLPIYKDRPFNRSLIGANFAMSSDNVHGIRDLAAQTLGVRVYGGAGISMSHVLSGHLLGYFSYIQPWDYAAALVMGEKLGYTLLTLEGAKPDFKTRQMVMFVPRIKLAEIQKFVQ